jgi:hypothetical protein
LALRVVSLRCQCLYALGGEADIVHGSRAWRSDVNDPNATLADWRQAAGAVPNLKTLDPQERVRSINHCGDTYKVTTADGKTRDFWERNLRFKKGAARRLGNPVPGACWERTIHRHADDRLNARESAPLGSGWKRGEQKQAVGRSRGGRNTKIHALADVKVELAGHLAAGWRRRGGGAGNKWRYERVYSPDGIVFSGGLLWLSRAT